LRQQERRSRPLAHMFRLVRFVILLAVAFGAGFLYSEISLHERCEARGGEARDGVCTGISQ
ncbi:MAG: hypothetical protein AAGA05_15000, partial [Pseudomonadota bacterium]